MRSLLMILLAVVIGVNVWTALAAGRGRNE